MAMTRWITLSLLLTTLASDSARPTENGESPDIGLVGNERILWIYQGSVVQDVGKLLCFAYRSADDSGSAGGRFFPQVIGPVTGRVAHRAVRGQNLHVFFGDGTHRRYAPGTPPWSVISPPQQFSEVSLLPRKSALPSAITADEARNILYALVTARQAAEMDALRPAPEETDHAESPESDTPPIATVPPEPPTDRVIVRYERGAWVRDRNAPAELTLRGPILQMFALDGAIDLVYRSEPRTEAWTHRRSTRPEAEWSAPIVLPLADSPVTSAGGRVGGDPVLLVAEADSGGAVVRSLRFVDDEWKDGPEFVDQSSRPVRLAEPLAVGLFAGDAAVATIYEGEIQVGRWSLGQGVPLEPLSPVKPLARPAVPARRHTPTFGLIVQYSILAAALAAVFVWRRDSIGQAAALKPDQGLARLTQRAVALLIDLVITAPIWGLVLYTLLRHTGEGFTIPEQIALGNRSGSPAVFWAWAVVGAVFGVYGAVFETAIQATPGKRIAGLFVVREDGGRCGMGAILVRNLVRVVEFHFQPVVLLVAVTVNRQRLGDLLARTVVVEMIEAPPPDSSDSADDGTDDAP